MTAQNPRFPLFEGALAQARKAVAERRGVPVRSTMTSAPVAPPVRTEPSADLPPDPEEGWER